jgi:hypothetical protein
LDGEGSDKDKETKQDKGKKENGTMNVVVAGSRNFNNSAFINEILKKELSKDDIIVSGMARGVDTEAYWYAHRNNHKCIEMPADWNRYGRRAGMVRNGEMLKIAEKLIAVWDGVSVGTKHSMDQAKARGIPTIVYRTDAPASEPGPVTEPVVNETAYEGGGIFDGEEDGSGISF